jgi:iron(III) transport system permease protein
VIGRRPPLLLVAVALAVSLAAATPLLYVAVRAAEAPPELWQRLWNRQIPMLLENTLTLLVTCVLVTLILGVSLAYLVERTDLPGRSIWRWLLAMPLAMPAYVAALSIVILLRRGGLAEQVYRSLTGAGQGELWLPDIYTQWGATFAIGLCVYPYVYLPVAAALRSMDQSLEDAARLSGRGAWGAFRDVTLPLAMPAAAAGALLVGLYVLADFGTVSMLRYRTFTTAIFNQFGGQVDRSGAAILSCLLVGMAVTLLLVEAFFARRNRRYAREGAWRPPRPVRLRSARWVAVGYVAAVLGLALGLPVAVLGGLSARALLSPTAVDRLWMVGNQTLLNYAMNSLLVAVAAATLATILAFAPSYLAARYPGRLAFAVRAFSTAGYAIPGLIVGLGFVLLFLRAAPFIYGTVAMLVIGFTFRLLPQSIATGDTALLAVPSSLERAARVMGSSAIAAVCRVTAPLAAPGILASWAIVFLTAMKELPAALMLRPPGFDTLPVRIMVAANESVYTQAALAAILLVAITIVPFALLHLRVRPGLQRGLHEHV